MDEYRTIDGKDFSDLIYGLYFFIKKVSVCVLQSIRRYFKTAIPVFIIVVAIGLSARERSRVFYEADMACTFKKLNKKSYGELIHSLDIYAKEHAWQSLAQQLNISTEDAQDIIGLEGKNGAGSMLYEDINSDKQPIYIDVKVKNNKLFPELETAILHYLNTSIPYLNAQRTADSTFINQQMQTLKSNISEADTMLAVNYQSFKKTKASTGVAAGKTGIDSLLKYRNEQEQQLAVKKRIAADQGKNVEVLRSFLPPERPSGNKDKILQLTIITAFISSIGSAVVSKAFHDGKKNQLA